MNNKMFQTYTFIFIRTVLFVLVAAGFAVGSTQAQEQAPEGSRISPNEIATVMFSVSADLTELEKGSIELTFWEEICKECAETGLVTSNTSFIDQQGERVDLSSIKKDSVLEAEAILFVSSSSRIIETVYLSK